MENAFTARVSGIALCLVIAAVVQAEAVPRADDSMRVATRAFLDSLDETQRAACAFAFDDAARFDWHFTPRERRGVALGELDAPRAAAFRALLETGLSADGLRKFDGVRALEEVLFERESRPDRPAVLRDPGNYAIAVFGDPDAGRFAWRVEGHHVSLHFTVSADDEIATTPAFYGASPAKVTDGEHAGLELLADEAALAHELFASLDETQRLQAVRGEAPADVQFGPEHQFVPMFRPGGIPGARMTDEQRKVLRALIELYFDDVAEAPANEARAALDREGLDGVFFLWMEAPEGASDERYYFRIAGGSLLIEWNVTAPGHVHSMWRDRTGDFGRGR